ncbi:MAG: sensor histidine kinase KdpD [Candidatus Omnitrophota bacterium]
MMENRPDPDQLLKQVQAEEARRGKLKIFFGAMAGVGKTYSMLETARHRKKDGVDVVVGYVETHKRTETEALLEGLEILPRKTVSYKNVDLPEFDIDAALKRNPSLILVDELAHTNAPGSRHLKRWQDVEELLAAGIDVYTTLNVQHCESVNDVITRVTGVVVRETVPDTFIEKAAEIELVDLPSEDLLKRLKEGKVYLGPQAEHAAQNFFQPGNLIALRQLALRYTAKNVDAQMRSFKGLHSISKIWNVGERFLVCISESPSAMNLIRAAKRIASEIGAPWTVAYVESVSLRQTEVGKKRAFEMLRFAEKLGAEVVTLNGQDIGDELIAYARSNNITKLIVGKPQRNRWQEFVSGSIVNNLARKCGEIDLYVISGDRQAAIAQLRAAEPPKSFSWKNACIALGIVALCSMVNAPLSRYLAPANLVLIYLLGVIWISFRYGKRVSFLASLLSALSFDYFFTQPYFSFTISNGQNVFIFVAMALIGFLISSLTDRLKQQTAATRMRENRNRILYELMQDLAKTSTPNGLFQALLHHVRNYFQLPVVIFTPNSRKELSVHIESLAGHELLPNEKAVAQWTYEHKQIAGQGSDTLPAAQGLYLPLVGLEVTPGVLGIFPKEKNPFTNPEQLHLLQMLVNQTALAVEGAELAFAALRAEDAIEKERIHNLLLSSFSYELPGPLSEISQAAAELLKPEIFNDTAKKDALIKLIQTKAQALNKLTAELPKILESDNP